ncbi:hypothetical protein LEP1GSC082_4254 [Leptospira kirschneri str. H2]|nr:hypothetical protein LEP1GSC082_4254 [Leptospira kirschneri str. H2]
MSISQINNYESKVQPVLRPALNQENFLQPYNKFYEYSKNIKYSISEYRKSKK